MRLGEFLRDPQYCGITKMVIVVVANNHDVDKRYIFDLARWGCEALRGLQIDRRAAILENRVEEDAQARWKFDQITCVTEPCRTEFWRFARVVEVGSADGDGGRGCVWRFGFTCEFAPSDVSQSF
jgi:hypothetical protein